jgi:hypothetical protein
VRTAHVSQDVVYTDKNLRDILNIPSNAFVVGRHGGYEQFDVPFVWNAISKTLNQRKDIYFLLLNTKPVLLHERIIYINGVADPIKKRMFINTCDIGFYYRDESELVSLLLNTYDKTKDYDVYSERFSPENVMKNFNDVFIY